MVPPTIGLVLAGGLSRRMGSGDKALLELDGFTLLQRVAARLAPQTAGLIVSANGDPARLGTALEVVADDIEGGAGPFAGPLAGVLAGLDRIAATRPDIAWLLSAPADCPFLPRDLAARLHAGRGEAATVHAASGGRRHPVVALWHIGLRGALRAALDHGERRVEAFADRHGAPAVAWPVAPIDPFLNINTPDDLKAAQALLAARPDA